MYANNGRFIQLIIFLPYGKGKVHPLAGHEAPEGEQRHSSIFSLTSALDGMSG